MEAMRLNRSTSHNRRLAQWRVTWLIEHSTSHQLLCWAGSFVLPCLPAGREIRHYAKPQNVCDLNQLLMKQVIECYLTDGRN